MKLAVVAVGRVRGALAEAVRDFERRAGRYWKLEVIEVPAGSGPASEPEAVRSSEAERVLRRVPQGLEIVALTRSGRPVGSRELAALLEEHAVRSGPGLAFAVGGAFGLGDEVLSRARLRLSLSAMTLPHEMARLVLAEQLYRAGTIIRGEPYHKG